MKRFVWPPGFVQVIGPDGQIYLATVAEAELLLKGGRQQQQAVWGLGTDAHSTAFYKDVQEVLLGSRRHAEVIALSWHNPNWSYDQIGNALGGLSASRVGSLMSECKGKIKKTASVTPEWKSLKQPTELDVMPWIKWAIDNDMIRIPPQLVRF